MNRNCLPRALVLAGILAAAGAAHPAAMPDEESSAQASVQTQTWFFPDGSSHPVRLDGPALTASVPDTTVLGAGPTMPLADDASDEGTHTVTQTWFFPDGSRHTVHMGTTPQPAGS